MAFPDNRLSSPSVPGAFIGSGAEALSSRTFDYEDGPIELSNPTQGLDVQQWRAFLENGEVWLEADNYPKTLLITPEKAITDISIAFNQNGDIFYTWVDGGIAKFYWYDTLEGQYKTTILPAGTVTPKVTLDDKRASQSGRSDVILSYINSSGELCFSMQRERFSITRVLDPGPFLSIERMYMNDVNRLQWSVVRK